MLVDSSYLEHICFNCQRFYIITAQLRTVARGDDDGLLGFSRHTTGNLHCHNHMTAENISPRQKLQTVRQQGRRPLFLNARSPAAVAAGRDARAEQPRLGEARRNARVVGPHGVQAHDASHQAHTARPQSLQADPTAASQLATLLAGPSQPIPS